MQGEIAPEILTSSLLDTIPWLKHGFGTRHAALSQDAMASLRQIHSAISLVAERGSGCIGEGDALITRTPGVVVSVRTADCFPILIADTGHRVAAAIHAGWRGTAARIVVEVLRRMTSEFGTDPREVAAAIGPGIGPCCYEVGKEVANQFGFEMSGRLDLAEQNVKQLIAAGVSRANIDVLAACTFCHPELFHSWRREGQSAGRMVSFIELRWAGISSCPDKQLKRQR